MDQQIINVLSNIPKDILIHCTEQLLVSKLVFAPSKFSQKSKRVCVKVANLRKIYDKDMNFEKWLENPNNVYCGRSGRIFVNKEYFRYDGSKWANPYTLKEYPIDECLKLYEKYIVQKIKTDPNYDLDELRSKYLGCWCDPKDKCHVDVLMNLI